jgi:hypothetical protein
MACASLFFAICAAPLAAWQFRNAHTTGYSGFSAITDQNLYFYQAAAVLAAREGESLEAKQAEMGAFDDTVLFEQHPEWRSLITAERYRQMGALAREIIRSDAWGYARIHFGAIAKLLITPGAGDLQQLTNNFGRGNTRAEHMADAPRIAESSARRRIAQLLLGGFLATLLALATTGCVFAAGPVWARRLLLVIAGYLLVVSGVPEPPARLRHPLMPVVCIFAGAGVAAIGQKVKTNRSAAGKPRRGDPINSDDPLPLRHAA